MNPSKLTTLRGAVLRGAVLALLFVALPAAAQVQRNYLNPGFETPVLVPPAATGGCFKLISETLIPGWTTTHPSGAPSGNCTSPVGPNGPLMELWLSPFNGVPARSGNNFAELNAAASSRLYQNVCLISGEQISWRFSHRGRGSAMIPDVMDYNVGASQAIVRTSTTNAGTVPAGTPIAFQGTVNTPGNGGNGWRDYSGSFAYRGATGVTSMGFESISAGSGNNTVGNFLDNIQIELRPFVEFTQTSSSNPESASSNRPTLRVNGTAFANFTVTVEITGGTATLGTDYTTPSGTSTLTVTIPGNAAGIQYDGVSANSLFTLPITVVNDSLVEANETISFRIVPPTGNPAPFLLNSSAVCGAAAQTTWLYTIVDDDSAITVTKNSSAPVPVAGQPTQFDLVYTIAVANSSATVAANYALSDLPGFDGDVSVVSASYTLNGTTTPLAGAGPWTLQGQWRRLAGGQTDTYQLNVRVAIARGGSIANDTCASPSEPGSGLHNAATATAQGSGGNPDSTFSSSACENTPTPAWVILRKQLQGRLAATDQAQVRIYAGGTAVATATTTGTTVPATAATPLVVVPAGTTLQFDEALKTNGAGADRPLTGYRTQLTCSSNGAPVPDLPSGAGTDTGTRQLWSDFTGVAGADVDCTITNATMQADLTITKQNENPTGGSVTRGTNTTYTIVVGNNGPDPATGAVVSDPAASRTGLTCPAPGLPAPEVACSSASAGACPQPGYTMVQLTSGITLGRLPAGSQATLTFRCGVN